MRNRVAFALLVLAGCQTGGQPVSLDDLPPALASVYCARTFECFGPDERDALIGAELTDEDSCVIYFTRVLFDAMQENRALVLHGQLEYDGEAATRCLSTFDDASCREIRIGVDYATRSCEDAFH
jgi:hypothetical protein